MKAFISCALGVEDIGYVLLSYGLAATIFSLVCGYASKKIGRLPFLLFGAAIHFSLLFAMLFLWQPDPSHPEVFFIVFGLWGMADSIWLTLTNGIMNPKKSD